MKRKTKIMDLTDYLWANQFETYKPKINKVKYGIFGTLFGVSLFVPFTTTPLLLLLPWVRDTPGPKRWLR